MQRCRPVRGRLSAAVAGSFLTFRFRQHPLLALGLGCWLGLRLLAAPADWAEAIARFATADAAQPPTPGGTVFVGSSSIRLWTTLAEDFPNLGAVNRGFGGSELGDTLFHADRLIVAHQPRRVVIYAGENDLQAGKSPEAVAADFRALHARLRAALPAVRLLYLSIKLSPARAAIAPAVRRANALLATACADLPGCTFVDVAAPLLDAHGAPRAEFFRADRLHLTPAGYAAWVATLRPHLPP